MGVFKRYSVLCFLIIMNLGVFAQNAPGFVLPKTTTDPIIIHLQSAISKLDSQSPKHLLQVFVETQNHVYKEQFAIQGSYKVVENRIIFTPDFPFMEGQNYILRVVDFNNSEKIAYTNTSFRILKKDKTIQARVVKIFPSSTVLPENTFRFYIYFSTPMKKEVALQHIHLIDKNGTDDRHAFMKFKSELWSPDGKRLTLLFDPGRIKRGVSTNVEKGAALLENEKYKLVVSNTWSDVYNQSLKETFTKSIEVAKGYRTEINVKDWKINTPKFETKEPLKIQFDRIFDHALLQNMILITKENGEIINGKTSVSKDELKWSFSPNSSWNNNTIFIQIDTRLEDIAGNNLKDLLDHTIMQGSKDIKTVRLPINLQ